MVRTASGIIQRIQAVSHRSREDARQVALGHAAHAQAARAAGLEITGIREAKAFDGDVRHPTARCAIAPPGCAAMRPPYRGVEHDWPRAADRGAPEHRRLRAAL